MSIALELVQGTARDFPFQITNPDGTIPVGIFLGTDVLTASVWAGLNESSLVVFTTAPSWISATNAQYQITFQNVDSSSLAVGTYYLQAYATRAGSPTRTTALLPRGTSLQIIAAAETAVPRPSYISIVNLRTIAPWIDDLQVPDSTSGFDDACADSRDWLDEMTLRNYRGGNVSLLGYHGFALDAWYTGGGRRTALTNRWLFAALQQNQLLVTPRVKQVCAYYALSRICESMITKSGQYVALAGRFRFEAESLLASTTVEIDVNGDGFGEVPINFSSTNTLWA